MHDPHRNVFADIPQNLKCLLRQKNAQTILIQDAKFALVLNERECDGKA